MVIRFIHQLTRFIMQPLLKKKKKKHLLKFKQWQKKKAIILQNLGMNHPCICLHFSPLGPLGKTVGDLKAMKQPKTA